MICLCYSVVMQHSISERILNIDKRIFEFINDKQKHIFFLFMILVQINAGDVTPTQINISLYNSK